MAIQLDSFLDQFKGLDASDIARWPEAPKWLVAILAMVAVMGAGYYFYLDEKLTQLKALEEKEIKLKKDYQTNLVKAVNLDALKKQKTQVSEYVNRMEKQLPDKAEMDKLLSDVNYAGTSKGLTFELFKPGVVRADAYYAELPITVKMSGTYHKLASFAAEVAALPRIVTLNNVSVTVAPIAQQSTTSSATNNSTTNSNASNANVPKQLAADTVLIMDATVKTFRYLDTDEILAAKKQKDGVKK